MAEADRRVTVKLIYEEDYPTGYPKKKDVFVQVTNRFKTAFNLQAESEEDLYNPVKKTYGSGNNRRERWILKGRGRKFSKSFKFLKVVGNKTVGYSAPCGGVPVAAVIKAAKNLAGCVGVVTPSGVSYRFGQPGVARPSGDESDGEPGGGS